MFDTTDQDAVDEVCTIGFVPALGSQCCLREVNDETFGATGRRDTDARSHRRSHRHHRGHQSTDGRLHDRTMAQPLRQRPTTTTTTQPTPAAPTTQLIAYTARGEDGNTELRISDPDGHTPTITIGLPDASFSYSYVSRWSPDSTRMAIWTLGVGRPVVADADGTNPTKIVDNVWWYFWSPMSFQAAMSRP